MNRRNLLALAFAPSWSISGAQEGLPPQASRLANLINGYRAELGLRAVPLSRSLTQVAEAHVRDLEASTRPSQCNMHSWSSAGSWSSCCYTEDHAQARCMWEKPREITTRIYSGSGYEIAYGGGGQVTPDGALASWKRSRGHNEVIVNQGIWSSSEWRAMGVAISSRFALVWFGKLADPAGTP